MLNVWLPWIALVVAIASFFARTQRATETTRPQSVGKSAHMAGGLCLALGIILAIAGSILNSSYEGSQAFGIAALVGLAVAAAMGFLGSRFDSKGDNLVAPVAFGVAIASVVAILPAANPIGSQLGVAFGLSAGAFILAVAPTWWPSVCAIGAGATAAACGLGTSLKPELGGAGIGVGVALAVVAVLGKLALGGGERAKWEAPLIGAVGAAASWLVLSRGFELPEAANAAALGCVCGIVVNWLVPKEPTRTSESMAIALVVGLGLATVAYGFAKGLGMSVALMGAALVPLMAGNARATAAMAPLGALVVYRLMRELHPDASRAFDIGQHYGLVGLMVGASIPVVATEWFEGREGKSPSKTVQAATLWVILLGLVPIGTAIVLGAKGYVGAMAGVGVATAISALKGVRSPHAFSIQMGISALLAGTYAWWSGMLDLTRDEKVQRLVGVSLAMAVIAVLIVVVSITKEKDNELTGN